MVGTVIAVILAIPVIMIPAAFVWYLNVAGVQAAVKAAQQKKVEAAT